MGLKKKRNKKGWWRFIKTLKEENEQTRMYRTNIGALEDKGRSTGSLKSKQVPKQKKKTNWRKRKDMILEWN